MIRQLEIEQTNVLKDLQQHYSWFNTIKYQFANLILRPKLLKIIEI